MGRIKSKNTNPELLVRKFLFSNGLRYRIHVPNLPGKPDIVLKKHNAIVLVNGCFWHAHEGCRYKKIPPNNSAFWMDKIAKTVLRDKSNMYTLMELGWCVYTVWECELQKGNINTTLSKLLSNIIERC